MELLGLYLRQHKKVILAFALFCAVFAVAFALYHLPLAAVAYPAALCALLAAGFAAFDFWQTLRRHRTLAELGRRGAALLGSLPAAATIPEADYRALVAALQAEATALQAHSDARYREMVEYYTVWAHQIKTPIAAMHLALQSEDTPFARQLTEDLFRIEQYVEMVLAFLRLDSSASDYVFKTCALDDILRGSVKKFAPSFILRHIRLQFVPTGLQFVSDEKWFAFVVEQLLSNALKYTPDGGSVCISLEGPHTLCVADSGIGIAPADLPRIFEKGFTGYNGRRDARSSGLGLYLCKRVCGNLGIAIRATSTVGEGTQIWLDLAQYALKKE